MQDQIVLGIALFGLFVAPFLTYGMHAYLARRDGGGKTSRAETTPSTTQAHPSRTIPGGGRRER